MDNCTICEKAATTRLIPEYRADLLGAPFTVFLDNAVKEDACGQCGRVLKTAIPDLEGLLHTVAATRAAISRKLSGAEIKFLRHAMGWKAKEIAEKLDMSPENFSRVENDTKPLGPQSEKLFRIYVIAKSIEKGELETDVAESVAKVFNLKIEPFWDPSKPITMRFVRAKKQTATSDNDHNGKWVDPDKKEAA